MEFIIYVIAMALISYTLGQLLMKKPQVQKMNPGKITFPNIEEGRTFPVVFGMPKWIVDATVGWWGNVKSVAIKKKVADGGWFHGDTYQTIGYKYYIGIHFLLCHAVDGIKQIKIGDQLIWPNPDDKTELAADGIDSITLDLPEIFGGDENEGGVKGIVDFEYGDGSQMPNDYLVEQQNSSLTFSGNSQALYTTGATNIILENLIPSTPFKAGDVIRIWTAGEFRIYIISTNAVATSGGVLNLTLTTGLYADLLEGQKVTLLQSTQACACRGLVGVILRQVYVGTSPYIQPWSFLVKRIPTDWYNAKAVIGSDMNPVHMIRECMTNTEWGLGHSTTLFEDSIWQPAANKLYNENFGLSALWEGDTTLENFIDDILRHIAGVLYQEPTTGKFILKLIRDDYDIEDLTTFNENSISSVEDFGRTTYGEIPDILDINYWNVLDNKMATIPDHDIAVVDIQGGTSVPVSEDFSFITNGDLAGFVAARERTSLTAMPASMTVKGNRSLSDLRPGDVFILCWSPLDIVLSVLRVLEINLGALENNIVTIKACEDIFKTSSAIYAAPPATGWEDPAETPSTSPTQLLIEAPFYTLLKNMGLANALSISALAAYLEVGAEKPTEATLDYELLVRNSPSEDFVSQGLAVFTPRGELASWLFKNAADATFEINNAVDLDSIEVGTYAVIENEIVMVLTVDVGAAEITVARGMLDTVPESHDVGSVIWFLESAKVLIQTEYKTSDTPAIKVLPRTGQGILEAVSATAVNAPTFLGRQLLPYAPGNFKINSQSYPANFSGQPTISWAHRDRTQQLRLVEHSAANIGPETGVTYTLKIYDQNDILVRTETGLTGTSYLYTEANERADCGIGPSPAPLNPSLRFELWAVRGTLASWQKYDWTINRV